MFDCCQKVFIHFLLYVLVRFHALRQGLVGCAAGHQVTEELAIRLGEARWKLLALLYNIIYYIYTFLLTINKGVAVHHVL